MGASPSNIPASLIPDVSVPVIGLLATEAFVFSLFLLLTPIVFLSVAIGKETPRRLCDERVIDWGSAAAHPLAKGDNTSFSLRAPK